MGRQRFGGPGGGSVSPGAGSGFTPLRVIRGGADGSLAETGAATFVADEGEDLEIVFDLSTAGQGDGGGWLARLTIPAQTTPGDAGNALQLTAGDGAPGSGATPGAVGGYREEYAGNGGAGTATAAAGAGGEYSSSSGHPGADNGGGGGAGGDYLLDTTAGTGAARHGDFKICTYGAVDATYAVRYLQLLTPTIGQLLVGVTTPSGAEKGRFSGSISPAANANAALYRVDGTIVEAGSGTHELLTGFHVVAPTITAGAGAVTDAATLYISAAPSASGARNYALFVDAGASRFDGAIIGSAVAAVGTEYLSIAGDTDGPAVNSPTAIIGRGAMGAQVSDHFTLAHVDRFSASGYALSQRSSDGATFINSAASIYLGIAGTLAWLVNGSLNLQPYTNNAYDIGTTGTRPRDLWLGRNIEIDGMLDHDGTTVGLYGATPVVQAAMAAAATGGAVVDAECRTLANALRTMAINVGLMAAA